MPPPPKKIGRLISPIFVGLLAIFSVKLTGKEGFRASQYITTFRASLVIMTILATQNTHILALRYGLYIYYNSLLSLNIYIYFFWFVKEK